MINLYVKPGGDEADNENIINNNSNNNSNSTKKNRPRLPQPIRYTTTALSILDSPAERADAERVHSMSTTVITKMMADCAVRYGKACTCEVCTCVGCPGNVNNNNLPNQLEDLPT